MDPLTATLFHPSKNDNLSGLQQCVNTKLPIYSKDVSENGAKVFFCCGYEYFINQKYIRTRPKNIYEVLQWDKPTKIYFDIDLPRDKWKGDLQHCLRELLAELRKFAKDRLKVDDLQLYTLDASTMAKISLHIIGGLFLNSVINVFEFVRDFTNESKNQLVNWIDEGVYTRNRSFRLAYSTKHGRTNPLLFQESTIYAPIVMINTMIQIFVPRQYNGPLQQLITDPNVFRVHQYKSPKPTLPSDSTVGTFESQSVANVPSKLREYFQRRGMQVRGFSRLEEKGVTRCIVSSAVCPWHGSKHKSNNQYFSLTDRGLSSFRCSDPECSKVSYGLDDLSHIFL